MTLEGCPQIPVIERCNLEPEHVPHGLSEIKRIKLLQNPRNQRGLNPFWLMKATENQFLVKHNMHQTISFNGTTPKNKSLTLMAEIGDAFLDLIFLPSSSV